MRPILHNEAARAALVRGAAKLARAVGCTLGPGGHVVLIEDHFGRVIATRDGVTVARAIMLQDGAEHCGARLLADAALQVANECGDGTTTCVVVGYELLRRCHQLVQSGCNPVDVAQQVRHACARAVDTLYRRTLALTTIEPAQQRLIARLVASVACKADPRVLDAVMDAYDHVGARGTILLREGHSDRVEVQLDTGYRLDRGWIDAAIAPQDGMRVSLGDCLVLATTRPLQDGADLLPVLRAAAGRSLLIVAPVVAESALMTLAGNMRAGRIRGTAVRAPGFGDRQWDMMHDLATFCGGTVEDQPGQLHAERLGHVGIVEQTRDRTILRDGGGDHGAVAARLRALESQRAESRSDYDRDKLGERLGRLRGKLAEILAGAPTPAEAGEIKHRIEDAVCAIRSAFLSGVQPGGGIALLRAAWSLGAGGAGGRALQAAMAVPVRLIAKNAGTDPLAVLTVVREFDNWAQGADAYGKPCNMLQFPDPTAVVVSALKAACSTVATVLLAETAILIDPNAENAK